jgi:tRNA1Val (adenine37-N6)-methyltransferase
VSHPEDELTVDALTADFQIVQRRRGHRTSVDDLLTAWYATEGDAPRTMLDLGTGIGSVGLYLAWVYREAQLTAIEVQDVSYALLLENVQRNRLSDRVHTIHGDLRTLGEGQFDLVTGSPPYFDVRNGIVSADPQRAGARFELKGDVRDYCLAARRNLARDARFVFCFPTAQLTRALSAIDDGGLVLRRRRDVVPKEGLAPLFTLFECRLQPTPTTVEPPFVVRDAAGVHTEEMTAARATFGMRDQRLTNRDHGDNSG